MDNPDPLSELADIHLPDPIGIMSPAPGWWILLVVLIPIVFFLTRKLRADWKRKRVCSFALRELDKCLAHYKQQSNGADGATKSQLTLNYVSEINAVLRRVALKHYPFARIASLSGPDWISFLRNSGDAVLLDDSMAATISEGRFAKKWDVDPDALYQMAHQWISSLYVADPTTGDATQSSSDSKAVSKHA
jgi:hypothetical protein